MSSRLPPAHHGRPSWLGKCDRPSRDPYPGTPARPPVPAAPDGIPDPCPRTSPNACETARSQGLGVISEIKRRSPSKGDLDPTLDPEAVAKEYEAGGAACLSVLTDAEFFGGSADDLAAARAACSLPVLRKDFTVSPLDVCDARLMGADAVLLIVAALSGQELASFLDLSRRCSLAALVEVHDENELERAVDLGAEVIGVNQRDLRTFEVDHGRALRMGEVMPAHVTAVAESGIESPADVRRLAEAG